AVNASDLEFDFPRNVCGGALRQCRFFRRTRDTARIRPSGNDLLAARRPRGAAARPAAAAEGNGDGRGFLLGDARRLCARDWARAALSRPRDREDERRRAGHGVLAVVVPALAGFAAGDRLSWRGWSGIALALAAIVLIGQEGAPADAPERRRSRGLGAAFLAGALLGAFLTVLKQTEPASGLLPLIPARLSAVAVLSLVSLFRRPGFRAVRSAAWLIVAAGALDVSANVLYLLAARLGTLTVAATLASLYPASTIVLARLFLGER